MLIALFFVFMLLVFTSASHGVVPGMWPFLQSVSSFLPQILLFLMVGLSAIFKFGTWKRIFAWIGRRARTKVGASVAAAVAILTGVGIYMLIAGSGSVANQLSSDGSQWATFRGGISRSGSADGKNGPQDGQEIWSFRETLDRAGFASSPAVVGNRAYVGADNDALYCFSTETGHMIWKFEAFYEVFSSPAVMGGKAYFGEGLHYTDDATFHCIDAGAGKEIWSFATSSHVESSPTVADGKVIFGAGDDGIYCLDAETGGKLWQYPSIHVDGSPAVHDGKVYFGSGYGKNGVYCLSLDHGSEIWTADTSYPAWGAPAIYDGKVYIGTGLGNFAAGVEEPSGSVVCLDAKTGEILWEFDAGGAVLGAVAMTDGRAYFGSRDSNLYCVDASSGEKIWSFLAGAPILSSPAVVKGGVYFGADNGKVYCLDTEDGITKWEFDTSESGLFNMDSRIIGSPAISGGKLFVGSMNFFFYCIGEESEG